MIDEEEEVSTQAMPASKTRAKGGKNRSKEEDLDYPYEGDAAAANQSLDGTEEDESGKKQRKRSIFTRFLKSIIS